MAEYMAQRIIDGVFTYQQVISKKLTLKDGIDTYLVGRGREDLITQ
jgi:hypothetical protein